MAVVLKRKVGEALLIGDNIRITVRELHRGNVKLVIEVPRGTHVLRTELIEPEEENDNAGVDPRDTEGKAQA